MWPVVHNYIENWSANKHNLSGRSKDSIISIHYYYGCLQDGTVLGYAGVPQSFLGWLVSGYCARLLPREGYNLGCKRERQSILDATSNLAILINMYTAFTFDHV